MKTIDPASVSHQQLHRLMLEAVAPRPIAFASTIDANGRPNLSPFSFFNAFGVNPSTLIFSPSRRGRDNTTKHTYQNIKEVPEVVINVVTFDMVEQVNLASTEYAKGVNEFEKAGFTALPSLSVKPFRVAESPVQFECEVREVIETGEGGGAANLVICTIKMVHVDEAVLDARGNIDPNRIRLVGRMGGAYYIKAFGDQLFKVDKPLEKTGIGIDSLPERIRHSILLNGNELGKLGNNERLPDERDIRALMDDPRFRDLFPGCPEPAERSKSFQLAAKSMLASGLNWEALCLLMAD
ncbi:MAG TPA: flavin reductase family protein [Bacteroidales bacterium]|nr:flavin reductase family protein [Bacteroidales bacterium]HSA43692.1 flavin reductase family protein [Bacteroidales bacterium]